MSKFFTYEERLELQKYISTRFETFYFIYKIFRGMDMIRKQKIGVEIKVTGITRTKAADTIANILDINVIGPINTSYHTRIIKDNQNREWKIMRDSSIYTNSKPDGYRVEFVNPPLIYEDIELLQTMVRKLKENGAKVNKSTQIREYCEY